jgi:cell division transport system permease protein
MTSDPKPEPIAAEAIEPVDPSAPAVSVEPAVEPAVEPGLEAASANNPDLGEEPITLSVRPPRFGLGAWFKQHGRAVRSSLQVLLKSPLTSLMTIGVIAIALALPAAFLLTLASLREVTASFEQPGQINAFLKTALAAEQLDELTQQLNADPRFAEVRVVTPEQALSEFRRQSKLADTVALLRENPLPFKLELIANSNQRDPAQIEAIAVDLRTRSQVDYVAYDRRWMQRFSSIIGIAERLTQVVGALLMLAVLLVVGNTIRLEIQERVDEIEITKLLGATDSFVRRPFLYSGALLGLMGGLLAGLCVELGVGALKTPVRELAESYASSYELAGLDSLALLRLLVAAVAIGLLGAWLAAGWHLRNLRPD